MVRQMTQWIAIVLEVTKQRNCGGAIIRRVQRQFVRKVYPEQTSVRQ